MSLGAEFKDRAAGPKPTQKDREAFRAAVYSGGDLDAAKKFLDAFPGHFANAIYNDQDTTLLMCAAARWRYDMVELLVKQGADVNLQNRTGDTALICAARNGNYKVVAYLLANGADIEVKSIHGMTADDWAQRKGHQGISRMIRKERDWREAEKAAARQRAMEEDIGAVYKGIKGEMEVTRSLVFRKKPVKAAKLL